MATRTVTKSADNVPYAGLSPERVLTIAEQLGLAPDGRLFALNSYENRVYRVGCDEEAPCVLKFYRAGRWSDAQIIEEHDFAIELEEADLPVAAPLTISGATLQHHDGFRIAAFPLCPGVAPDLDAQGTLTLLGRTLARLHARGGTRAFRDRPELSGEWLGERARRAVLASPQLPDDCRQRYDEVSARLLAAIRTRWDDCGPLEFIRLHGDCHLGNILWNERGPLFVDLDDCQNGPAIQDLWMFLSGDGDEQRGQWAQLIEGYEQFADFDYRELGLIEALRATRMLNHTAWIAARWTDPAFPRAFPEFAEPVYWQRHINDLAEQVDAVGNPPIMGS